MDINTILSQIDLGSYAIQTVEYLEWFDENWKDKVKNIYVIICLNSPSAELLEKVHDNPRIRVFEYQISYYER